ncbi:hypothetical protein PLANPX_3678 [Lacipirellula parvula]|uniref:Uncharacterized protein n=1 Tax=Lacipirellula parvula TaxID=2650471 RepID=A0A5K7XID5_9BACT|nr:hypothetical protein PLANPX_3678 [Lacipirellula parvula]
MLVRVCGAGYARSQSGAAQPQDIVETNLNLGGCRTQDGSACCSNTPV